MGFTLCSLVLLLFKFNITIAKTCATNEVCADIKEEACSKLKDDYKTGKLTVNEVKEKSCNNSSSLFCCEVETKECAKGSTCKPLMQCEDTVMKFRTGRITRPEIEELWCAADKFCCIEKIDIGIRDNKQPDENDPNNPAFLPSPDHEECGINWGTSNIIGGKKTKPGTYSFTALLGVPSGQYFDYVCGGSLINRWYVLSAAHCFKEVRGLEEGSVNLGEWKISKKKDCFGHGPQKSCLPERQLIRIQGVKIHEEYRKKFRSVINDIALIKLRDMAVISVSSKLSPVCLPFGDKQLEFLGINNFEEDIISVRAHAIGWGRTSTYWEDSETIVFSSTNSTARSDVQQYVDLPILSNDQCSKFYQISDTQICAGAQEGKDTCSGDSGGPLVINKFHKTSKKLLTDDSNSAWFLVGIVSFGSTDCGSGSPAVYTRVTEYIPWIRKNLV